MNATSKLNRCKFHVAQPDADTKLWIDRVPNEHGFGMVTLVTVWKRDAQGRMARLGAGLIGGAK